MNAPLLFVALLLFVAGTILVRRHRTKGLRSLSGWFLISLGLTIGVLGSVFRNGPHYPSITTVGPARGPFITIAEGMRHLRWLANPSRTDNIARNPSDVPAPVNRTEVRKVEIKLETTELVAEMADGTSYNYWTFNNTVPGPLLRIQQNDTVELTLTNNGKSIYDHNIDLHAVTGPGGGATATNVAPGETKSFTFKALNPGLYVYHCAHPNAAAHMAHGMYGLILVEPTGGLPPVDKEYYLMQGEFYGMGEVGSKGLQNFDAKQMLAGMPDYVVFNGRVGGANGAMKATVGERVRLYVGNGGVNLISSFHVIGEIFDRVYPEASLGAGSTVLNNVQTTLIPAGGATIVEFTVDVPGTYVLVDHALARMDRGAWATLKVTGEPASELFHGEADTETTHGH